MSISRPFAYNTGSSIPGTEQVGDLAVGWPSSTSISSIWNGTKSRFGL